MRKILFLFFGSLVFFSCGVKTVAKKEEKSCSGSYSLLDSVYKNTDRKVIESLINLKHEKKEILKTPKYVKIYRGSYRDEKGNVVEGGIEYLLIDDATPDTDF